MHVCTCGLLVYAHSVIIVQVNNIRSTLLLIIYMYIYMYMYLYVNTCQ